MLSVNRIASLAVRSLSLLVGFAGLLLGATTEKAQAGSAHCAIYGPDFVPVEGTDTCVRIGGRVRLDVGNHLAARPDSGWGNGELRPAGVRTDAADPDGLAPRSGPTFARHLRVPDGIATTDPFQR